MNDSKGSLEQEHWFKPVKCTQFLPGLQVLDPATRVHRLGTDLTAHIPRLSSPGSCQSSPCPLSCHLLQEALPAFPWDSGLLSCGS